MRREAEQSVQGNCAACIGPPPAAAAAGANGGAEAFDRFSRALTLCQRREEEEARAAQRAVGSQGGEGGGGEGSGGAQPGAVPSAGLEVVRRAALSWLGRCHLEACGVPRDVGLAARLFRDAGNEAELEVRGGAERGIQGAPESLERSLSYVCRS